MNTVAMMIFVGRAARRPGPETRALEAWSATPPQRLRVAAQTVLSCDFGRADTLVLSTGLCFTQLEPKLRARKV